MPRSLVTGAGHRLGRAIALYLAARGHSVAVHYAHSAAGAQDTVDQIVAMGGTAHALQADLLDEDAAAALLPRAAEILGGPITCLINNASIFEDDSLTTATKGQLGQTHGQQFARAVCAKPSNGSPKSSASHCR